MSFPIPQVLPAAPGALRVLTLNIRAVDRSVDDVQDRAEALAGYLRRQDADLVMLQEAAVLHGTTIVNPCPLYEDLSRRLPEYGWIRPMGVATLSGSNPILYRRSRFMPVRQGIVWLSDTPDVPDSRSWGNEIPRYATWAVFFDRHGPSRVLTANVHLDHLAQRANARAMQLIAELVETESESNPVIVAGDFNAPPRFPTRAHLTPLLASALSKRAGPTHLAFPRLQIDGVYYGNGFHAEDAWIDPEPTVGGIQSDHAAVHVLLSSDVR